MIGSILRWAYRTWSRNTGNWEQLKGWLETLEGGGPTAAGVPINSFTGTKQEVVYICIKRLSDAIAMTPWPLFRRFERSGAEGREELRAHSVWRLLNVKANRDMTAFTWKQTTAAHILGWGNAFSAIIRNGAGEVVELVPMHPGNVRILGRARNGQIIYEWMAHGIGEEAGDVSKVILTGRDVLHIRGLSWDGIVGISPIMQLRELIGRARAREDFQSRFYGNGCVFGGAIKTPEALTDEQLERHRESFEKLYKGSKNAWKILILEGAESFTPFGVNPKDAEFVLTGKLDAARISASYGVPLQLINDTDAGAARASAEQLFREYLLMGVNPWMTNFEMEANAKLLTPSEQAAGLYSEFDREYLVRADAATFIEGLKTKVLTAIITPNEARKELNLNPIDGGDVLLAPVNMMPIDMLGMDRQVDTNPDGSVARVTFIKQPAALPPGSEQ